MLYKRHCDYTQYDPVTGTILLYLTIMKRLNGNNRMKDIIEDFTRLQIQKRSDFIIDTIIFCGKCARIWNNLNLRQNKNKYILS